MLEAAVPLEDWMIPRLLIAAAGIALTQPDVPEQRTGLTLESVVTLEEHAADPIGNVTRLAISPAGVLAIPDQQSARVRLYTPEGRLIAALGRKGAGPGEFERVVAATFDDRGRLYVADAALGRITRYSTEWELDTIFPSPQGYTADVVAGRTGLMISTSQQHRIVKTDFDGRATSTHLPPDARMSLVPYWASVFRYSCIEIRRDMIVASNLLYPAWRYASQEATPRAFGTPPAFYIAPEPPERGRFAGERQRELPDWLRTLTVIDRLVAVNDSFIVVVQGRYDPEGSDFFRMEHSSLDIYDFEGSKLWEAVPAPGRILGSRQHLHVLLSEPPEGWRIGRYSVSRPSHPHDVRSGSSDADGR